MMKLKRRHTAGAQRQYSEYFYNTFADISLQSAQQVVPLLCELISPTSVVDVGCGLGQWLSTFQKHGAEDVLGIDGNYVNPGLLHIPRDRFLPHDLRKPLQLDRKFDLAVSLEVAEHLPEDAARGFVASLCGLSAVVVFSAAIPFQGGMHHVNEQWPEYWVELFAGCGYVVVDCVRPRIWSNPDVAYYYAQNVLIFVAQERLADYPALALAHLDMPPDVLSKVHPRKWSVVHDPRQSSIRTVLRALPFAVRNSIRHHGGSLLRRLLA
jgi:SAM-dependent methyltransferase